MSKRLMVLLTLSMSLLLGARAWSADAEGHGAETTAAQHAAHESAPLLPSNAHEAKEHFLAPAIWTLIIFLVLVVILYFTAWKQVLVGLKSREQRIRQDIADAESARKKADATLKEYNTQLATAENRVREMLAKAQADGEKLATNIRMQAQQDAEEARERATREIESAKNAAIREVHEQTAELATSVAAKILKRNLNVDDQRELVRQSLEQLQTVR